MSNLADCHRLQPGRWLLIFLCMMLGWTLVEATQDAKPTAPANAKPDDAAAKAPQATEPVRPPDTTTPAPTQPRPAPASSPATGGETAKADANPMLTFLFMSVTGWILIFCYVSFVALLVLLILDLRSSHLMPPDLIDAIEEALNKKKYKEAFDVANQDPSLFGRVMAAGMARLQNGLNEARDASTAMLENLKARKDHLMAYVAILGTLGPLIGLVGTVAGMIATFAELGQGGTPNASRLAKGISHALNATLVGIFLSVLAIPAYSFFKNRLLRIVLDADLLADDLLTQTFHASKKGEPEAKPGIAVSSSSSTKPLNG